IFAAHAIPRASGCQCPPSFVLGLPANRLAWEAGKCQWETELACATGALPWAGDGRESITGCRKVRGVGQQATWVVARGRYPDFVCVATRDEHDRGPVRIPGAILPAFAMGFWEGASRG